MYKRKRSIVSRLCSRQNKKRYTEADSAANDPQTRNDSKNWTANDPRSVEVTDHFWRCTGSLEEEAVKASKRCDC